MNRKNVIGFVTDIGGRTSHTAIMAKSLEIPAVVGLEKATQLIRTGDTIILNGIQGIVVVNPSTADINKYKQEQLRYMEFSRSLKRFKDDVPEEIKSRRLEEVISLHLENVTRETKKYVGYTQKVLLEGYSKKSSEHYYGRNDQNVVVVVPKGDGYTLGDFVDVYTTECTAVTLIGNVVKSYPRNAIASSYL